MICLGVMLDRRDLLAGAAALGAQLALGGVARAAPGDISLIEQNGRFLVEVRLNDGPAYRFVLDTGASTHFISASIADRLRLPKVDVQHIRSYAGRTREAIVALRRLNVGGIQVADARAVAWNADAMEGHDGLLGYPIIGSRALLDLGARRLGLGAPPPASGAVRVEAEVSREQTVLLGGASGIEGRFVFDTGATRCVISRAFLTRLRETDAYAQASQVMNVGSDGQSRLVGLRLPELRFGDLVLDRPFVRIADREASPEMFQQVDALLGVELIRRCAWTVDLARGTLHASPSAAA